MTDIDVDTDIDVINNSSSSSSSSSSKATTQTQPTSKEQNKIDHNTEVRQNQRDKAGADSLPWVEKYRPSALDDLISHGDIVLTLSRLLEGDRLPHLLFYGPPGTGKTTAVLAIARKINGPNFASMVLELNASDDRGIDVVRDQIRDFASSQKLFTQGLKLIILDEADQMTKVAQFALRRIMEKYTRTTRFCLICNYVNKIIPALQSRCTRFRFGPLNHEESRSRLLEIASAEGLKVESDGVDACINLAQGDMRRVLNVAQSCSMAFSCLSAEAVYLTTGNPTPENIKQIVSVLLEQPIKNSYETVLGLQNSLGLSLVDIVHHVGLLLPRVSFPPRVLCFLLSSLADLEARLSEGATEKVQLAGMCGVFARAKQMIMNMNEKQ